MSDRVRVRILVGDLSRTGVPVVLERLARWARAHAPADVDVVAIRGGDLEPDLRSTVSSLTTLEPTSGRSPADAVAAGLISTGRTGGAATVRATAWRVRTRRLPRPDVVVLHGAGAWPALVTVHRDVPLVVHLHELEVALDRSIPHAERAPLLHRATTVMAVAGRVAELARRDGARPDRIAIVPGLIGPREHVAPIDLPGIPESARLVAGAGAPGWRKGTDRFVALAHALGRSDPDAGAIWVGGHPTGAEAAAVGSPDPVTWVDPRPHPWQLLGAATVLVVPSREDPLPLVALEAAQHRVPVIGGATGGLEELLAEGRGLVVPVHDARALHRAAHELLADPEAARDFAEAAAGYVEAHHAPAVIGPLWWSIVAAAAR